MRKKIGIGIIGMGKRGIYFGGHYFGKHPDCELVGMCDTDPERLRLAQEKLGPVSAVTEVNDLLGLPDLDAVVICSYDKVHAEQALAALRAGKHVYLEKPMAQTVEDCDELIRIGRKSGKVFMVGLELRYCSLFEDMKAIISSGEIGDIKIGTVIDNVSVGGNYYFQGLRRRKDFVKSLVLEKGTHSLDIANWLIDANPVRVYSTGGLDVFGGKESNDKRCRDCEAHASCEYYVDPHSGRQLDYGNIVLRDDLCVYAEEIDVHDNSLVTVDYDNGAKISYMECHFTPEYSREFMFVGTKGKITGFYNNEQDFKITVRKRQQPQTDAYFPIKRDGEHGGGDIGIVNTFVELVRKGEPAMPGVIGARNSAAIAIAAAESEATGQPAYLSRAPE